MLVRAAALERVGGFDERFWSYFEEAELCLRARRAGFRVGVVLDAVAEQAPGGPGRPGVWSYLMTRNGVAYAWRAAGPGGLALCRRPGRLRVRARADPRRSPTNFACAAARRPNRGRSRSAPRAACSTSAAAAGARRRPFPARGTSPTSRRRGATSGEPERPRVLHVGPDVRGGMRAVMRGLLLLAAGRALPPGDAGDAQGDRRRRADRRLLPGALAPRLVEPARPRPDRPRPRDRARQHAAQVLRRPAREGAAPPRRPAHALGPRRLWPSTPSWGRGGSPCSG